MCWNFFYVANGLLRDMVEQGGFKVIPGPPGPPGPPGLSAEFRDANMTEIVDFIRGKTFFFIIKKKICLGETYMTYPSFFHRTKDDWTTR